MIVSCFSLVIGYIPVLYVVMVNLGPEIHHVPRPPRLLRMSSFPIDEAHLVSLFTESVFYGLFLATFVGLLRAILWNGTSFNAAKHVRWALLSVACTMFVVATVDLILNLKHNLNAFIYYKGPGGPVGEFSKISHWINIARVRSPRFFATPNRQASL